MSFIAELGRRNVIRMAGLYLVGAWLLTQVAGTVLPMFGAPEWLPRSIVVLLALGFVPALIFSWVFELTPDGIKRDADVAPEQSIAPQTARRMDRMIIAVLALALVYFAFDRIVLAPRREAVVVAEAVRTHTESAKQDAASATAIDQKSVAVLPFVNMSGEQAQEYFSDGISEEILNALAQVQGLKVVGRTSSFKFKGHNEDLRRIGEQLGVAHLLEGSVRKQGDAVRVTAQLIKVQDGFHLWSKTFERKLTDVFAIQDEISAAIATALSVRIMSGDAARHDADPVAYDLYLRARQLVALRTAESLRQGATLFEASAVIDPKFDGAYSGLARTLAVMWGYEVPVAGGNDAQRGARAAKRALALNARNAEAHSALGVILVQQLWDWDEGMRAIRAAIELAPNDAEVANLAGDVFRVIGDLEQGDRWERRAIELDPLLPVNYVDLGYTLLAQRRCREAIEPLSQVRRMTPDGVQGLDPLARAHLCLRDFAAAKQAIELIASRTPGFAPEPLARLALKAGQREQAQGQIKLLQARADKGELLNYQLAQLYALSGDNTAAATALTHAIAQHDPFLAGDEFYLLPEDWPDDPAIRAALDHPSIKPLFEMRRGFIQSQKLRVGHD